MTEIYDRICSGENLRSNLRDLYNSLSDEKEKRTLVYRLGGDFRVLTGLLENDDPKVRRLAALILGQMETEDVLPDLMRAWEKERTLFIRYAYPEAMKQLDVSAIMQFLKKREKELYAMPVDEASGPHIRLELTHLHELMLPYETFGHRLNMEEAADAVILLCPHGCGVLTAQEITSGEVKVKGDAVHVRGGNWEELLRVRTWSQLLIPLSALNGGAALSEEPLQLGRELALLDIPTYLNRMCTGTGRWRYRLEIKTGDESGKVIRSICSELDRVSRGALVNDPGTYELTIRLLKKRDGGYAGFIKLSLLPDHRFAYRESFVAESMTGIAAACTVAVGRQYSKCPAGANVLDPFCGVGTLLLERRYSEMNHAGMTAGEKVSQSSLYGTDIFGEAIEKGRENALRTKIPVHLIQRDYFDFTHNHLFDEVITDLPRIRKDGRLINSPICRQFFRDVPRLLRKHAVLTIYTLDAEGASADAADAGCYQKLTRVVLNEKSGASVLVFRYTGENK